MKILFWNVRAIGNLNTKLVLKEFCSLHKPEFLFISEPWISMDQIPLSFWKQLKLKPIVVNDRADSLPNL